jgi:hypothetical protein
MGAGGIRARLGWTINITVGQQQRLPSAGTVTSARCHSKGEMDWAETLLPDLFPQFCQNREIVVISVIRVATIRYFGLTTCDTSPFCQTISLGGILPPARRME